MKEQLFLYLLNSEMEITARKTQRSAPDEVSLANVLIAVDDHLGVEQNESAEESQSEVELGAHEQSEAEHVAEQVAPEHDVEAGEQEAAQEEQRAFLAVQSHQGEGEENEGGVNQSRQHDGRVDFDHHVQQGADAHA